MNSNSRLKSVVLVARPWLRYFFPDFARALKRRYGSAVHFYVRERSELAFYEQYVTDGSIDSVTYCGIMHDPVQLSEADRISTLEKARTYERKFNRTINSISACEKMLGAPFSIGGYRFPRSNFFKNSDEVEFAAAFVRLFEFWENEFRTKNITCFLNGWTEFAMIAKLHNIPFRHLIEVGYENYCHWATNEFHENPLVEAKFNEISAPAREKAEITEPYLSARIGNQSRLDTLGRWSFLAGTTYRTLLRQAKNMVRRRRSVYPLSDELKYNWLLFSQFRMVSATHREKLADLEDTDFIFFPLAREPEIPYMMMSPEYFYQIPAIASLVRDLPTGWRLAVKEHVSAIGPRPVSFYDQIRYFKQVRLMDIRERGVDCVRKAKAVATIAGSAGIEAAVAGKPVISFGRHNIYCFLPHVMVVKDEAQIAGYIDAIVENKIDLEKARQDGARFLEAIVAASFDMRNFDWENMKDYDPQVVEDAVTLLVESLAMEDKHKVTMSQNKKTVGV